MTETTPEKNGAKDVPGSTNKKGRAETHHWWFHLNREALQTYAGGLVDDSVLVPVIDTFTDELNTIISSSRTTISSDTNRPSKSECDVITKKGSKDKILNIIFEILKTLVQKLPPTFQIEDYTDALGKWLFDVFSDKLSVDNKDKKKLAYGVEPLGKFAGRTYKDPDMKGLWEMKNDDGFASAFGTLISYMKIQDSEQSSDDSVDPVKAHSWICKFHHYVKEIVKNAENVSDDIIVGPDDITVGTVYSVFNIQIAKIMNLIMKGKGLFSNKPSNPSPDKNKDSTNEQSKKNDSSPQKKDLTPYELGKLLVTKFINKKYFTVDDLDHFWNFVNECENEKIIEILPKILDCLCYIGNYENNIPRIVKKIFENQTNELAVASEQLAVSKASLAAAEKERLPLAEKITEAESKAAKEAMKKQKCIEILYVFLCNKYENDKPRLLTIISEIDFQFVELLEKNNLKIARECFKIFVPQKKTVLRGRFALCEVEPINIEINIETTKNKKKSCDDIDEDQVIVSADNIHVSDGQFQREKSTLSANLNTASETLPAPARQTIIGKKLYKLSKISDGFKGDETVGDFIILKDDVFEKPQWISSPQDEEKSIKESIQEIVSKRKCVRIASWNVACMNNLDKPTTSDELKTKVNNISEIIIKSGCDVVALQELPFELHIKEDIEKEIIAFDKEKVGFKDQLLLKLNTQTNSNWDIQWTTSFYDDAKKSEGQGVLAFVYNKDIVTLQNPENTGLKIIDQREKSERTKRMPCIASFKVGKLEFILCNVHISPKNAHSEIEELGNDLLPTIQSHYGYLRSKSVIFLGDFNMSIVSNGAFAKPKPKESTWSAFQTGKFNPCIRDCFTNVIQTMLYDNIWIHESMDNIRHISKKLLGMQEKGVFEIKGYIDNENNTKMLLRSDYKDLQKKASDHNLVFIDLKVNKAMQWSEDIVIKGKMISMWDSP